jgi:hypothetical protein
LEAFAASEASSILGPIFAAGAIVTVLALPPALALGGRARILRAGAGEAPEPVGEDDGGDRPEPTFAL